MNNYHNPLNPLRFPFHGTPLQINWEENTEEKSFYFELFQAQDEDLDGSLYLLNAEKYFNKEPKLWKAKDREALEKRLEEIGISDLVELEAKFLSQIENILRSRLHNSPRFLGQ